LRDEWSNLLSYFPGDVVRLGNYLYVAISNNTNQNPETSNSWELLVPGERFIGEWQDNENYLVGDIITYKGTAYVCVASHLSTASDSRPDLDILQPDQDYWQLFIQGAEGNVLEIIGDIKIFDADDVALSIGNPGQILKVNSNLPSWQNYELVPKTYYVSTEGTDAIGFGTQLSSPFRTIKYACDYILENQSLRAPATIFVKTGFYEEILPISIPADVAIVGDELRSTSIAPAPGFETENMFYVRNGSGLRNCTLTGLTGTLGPVNQYLTRRPTAGAYVSLDPGAGPNDATVWITNKSPYIQNVSTFGTGCIGMKIDGSLHSEGNRSIVANDFTQILSDGIGYWATNSGRSELVSVFTYYCHIGYLAESGGILRGTNGNNSYGTFGSVAEGFDLTETPIVGQIDNQTQEALVDEIFTFGTTDQIILSLGYSHTGQEYSSASISFNGSGFGASGSFEEFRDNAISEIRIINPEDSSRPGGLNYTFVVNSAQLGDITSITLAAADTASSSEYVGQRIVILSGRGVGQYAEITSYNDVSKVATVSRESDGASGWDHFQPGWPIESVLDSTTRYAIEPRIIIDEPGFTANSVSAPSADTWSYITYGESKWVAVSEGGVGNAFSTYSADGFTWSTSTTLGTNNFVGGLVYTGSKFLALRTETGSSGNVSTILQSADGEAWAAVNLGTSSRWKGIASNGSNVAIITQLASASTILRSTNDGDSWSSVNIGTAATWGPAAYGNGKFVILDTASGRVAYSTNNGASWTVVTPLSSGIAWNSITYGNGRFVAVDDSAGATTNTAYSFDGITWYESEIGTGEFTRVSYGAGVFLATGTGNLIAKSADGKVWRTENDDSISFNTTTNTGWKGSFYADNKWIVVSSSGVTWNSLVTGARAIVRAKTEGTRITKFLIYDPGSNYATTPSVEIFDNENTSEAQFEVRVNSGVLPQPEMSNRGSGYFTAIATITGNGFADIYQTGLILNLKNLTDIPRVGANLSIDGINDVQYRVTRIESFSGSNPFNVSISINPNIGLAESPDHETNIIIRKN
jgi:hypothetical protein